MSALPPRLPARDPWAHRRGEPRVFAFLWTVYVMLAVGGSVLWASRFAAMMSAFGPAARIMLVVVAVGATVLWPMVRLSQESPRTGVPGRILADVLIVLAPVQLVLWPLAVLANWPLGIVGAIACMLSVWTILVGGVLALGLGGAGTARLCPASLIPRTFWMLVIIFLVGWAPLAALAIGTTARPAPAWLALLSPLTAVPTLTGKGISGPQIPVSPEEWNAIIGTGVAAILAWALAFVRSMLGRRGEQA